MKKIYSSLLAVMAMFSSFAQTTVFSDDFSSNTNAAYTTTGSIGVSAWTVLVQNADWGARRNTTPEQLELTNDASATANAIGWALASTPTSSFLSPYNTTLNLNPGTVTWNLNIRQIRSDPAGLASGSYGAAFVLAGTSSTTRTVGNGYAITYGQSGTTDPIRLIEYTAGLGTSSNIITSNTTGLTDFGAEYLSVRVIYTPSTNTWELLLRNDGSTSFADPASGTLVSQGTAVNSTYSGTPLMLMGAFWNGSTAANQTAFFDNTSVVVGVAAGPNVSVAAGSNATEGGGNGTFIINFSQQTAIPLTLDYSLPVSGNATFTTDYGGTLVSSPTTGVTPSSLSASNGVITVPAGVTSVTLTVTPVDDVLNEGTEPIAFVIANPSNTYVLGNATATINLIDNEAVTISSIQGSGTTATAGSFTVDAIVTGIYSTLNPAGFYIQEEDADNDADVNTSEGIFVVSTASVAVGDKVRVSGTVQENGSTPSFNQAVFATATVTVLSSGNPLPTSVDISLPVSAIADYEKYEGMLVRFPQTLTVSDNERLGDRGEVKLSANGLVYQPTQVIDPNDNPASGTSSTGTSNLAAVNALIASNNLRTILLDDGRGTIPTLPYVNADNTLRIGSTTTNTSGILGFGFSQYRIQPLAATPPTFSYAPRPVVPSIAAGNLKIASFNVLNYFNGNGAGGGFPTSRGAHSVAEFTRQRDKIINSLSQMNADVVGLIEIENLDLNDATPALQDLVNGLNAVMGAGTYSFIDDDLNNDGSQDNNTDQIRCAIIYKSSVVTPVGGALLSNNAVFDRPALSQTFNLNTNNLKFNFVVNHFKSKGGSGTGADADQGDGQAAFNDRRKQQATQLLNFFTTTVIPASNNRIITVGDYNAYYEEDPMDILRAGGYRVLGSATSYSYLFEGQVGSLDHAVVSNSLLGTVLSVEKWNANASEPTYLSYEDAVADGGGDVVNPWASTYTVSPWRASDHDAILLFLDLTPVNSPLPVKLTSFNAVKNNGTVKLTWITSSEINAKEFIIERATDGNNYAAVGKVNAAGNSSTVTNYVFTDNAPAQGNNFYRLRVVDVDAKFEFSRVIKIDFRKSYTVTVSPNPAKNTVYVSAANAAADLRLEIVNSSGSIVYRQKIQGGLSSINISILAKGSYLFRFTASQEIFTEKIIKE